MTDTLEAQDAPAPPSYDELTAGEAAQSDDVKGDFNVDAKAASADETAESTAVSSSQPTASSSSQLFAPSRGAKITDPPIDDKEARRLDDETWPKEDPRLRTDAVYGLYVKTDNMYGGLNTLKITDYNGGIAYHVLWSRTPPKRFETLHLWMVPGDQVAASPRSSWRFPMMKMPLPATPQSWTWKYDYDKQGTELECVDGRVSKGNWKLWDCERQTTAQDCLPTRRDRIYFTVPSAKGADYGRQFVWVASGIMRNRDSQRWDQCQYLLHEKGDYTKVYGAFSWRQDYCIDFRQLPSDLEHEHPLLLFTLSCLVMDQHKKCTKWPAASYEKSGFSQDLTRLSFNVAALQKRAADLLGPRYVPAPQ